jgi:hypothetical protein
VFFPGPGRQPGFDLALGNPPCDVKQLEEEGYFSSKAPDIARLSGEARKRAINALRTYNPSLWEEYEKDKRILDAANDFFRSSGRFPLTAVRKINTYALFAEIFGTVAQRAGAILPLGVATSDTLAAFFASLVNQRRLSALISFAEIKHWFPGSKDNQSFCLLALTQESPAAQFAFRLWRTEDWKDDRRRFSLSAENIASINPNTRTAPIFRSRADAELTAKVYARLPVLIHEAKGSAGNSWNIEFRQGLFNMTSDSGLFRSATQLTDSGFRRDGRDFVKANNGDRYVPLYEAKMMSFYDHRFGSYPDGHVDDTRALPRPSREEQEDHSFEVSPRYWVSDAEVANRLATKGWTRGWLMGWRDVTNTTNERTVIVATIPRSAAAHKMPLFFLDGDAQRSSCGPGCLDVRIGQAQPIGHARLPQHAHEASAPMVHGGLGEPGIVALRNDDEGLNAGPVPHTSGKALSDRQ